MCTRTKISNTKFKKHLSDDHSGIFQVIAIHFKLDQATEEESKTESTQREHLTEQPNDCGEQSGCIKNDHPDVELSSILPGAQASAFHNESGDDENSESSSGGSNRQSFFDVSLNETDPALTMAPTKPKRFNDYGDCKSVKQILDLP
jgi:hypothetical protein